jgi:hypothetical protein
MVPQRYINSDKESSTPSPGRTIRPPNILESIMGMLPPPQLYQPIGVIISRLQRHQRDQNRIEEIESKIPNSYVSPNKNTTLVSTKDRDDNNSTSSISGTTVENNNTSNIKRNTYVHMAKHDITTPIGIIKVKSMSTTTSF